MSDGSRLPLPNLLATRVGRLIAFFLLYVTEGIPLGFAATAVATQLRRQDVGPAEIGAFVGAFYVPWAFKWAFGPIIDVFGWRRVGHRRGWILMTQVVMALTLLSTVLLKLPEQLWLFTIILLVHNTFGAMQDVAIDALACNTLKKEERGLANGMMFSGAYIGSMLGGGGVLLLSGYTGFQATFFAVAGAILLVTVFVVVPMREQPMPERAIASGSRTRAALGEMHTFAVNAFKSFLGSRGAFAGVFFSILPPGAICLGLALQSTLAVELGLNDDQVGTLSLLSAITSAAFCVVGGVLSDRLGRQRTLFTYISLMGLPVLYLMTSLTHHGWIMPIDPNAQDRPEVPAALLNVFYAMTLCYSAAQGLMYGTRSAIMMDVTNPKVAGTQFTAYMALANVAIAYSATWQGAAIERWGYPTTMLTDVIIGAVCLALIPFLKPGLKQPSGPSDCQNFVDAFAPARARWAARLLGIGCVAWIPARLLVDPASAMQPILGTFFTLVFVASALFLLAGGAVLRDSAPHLARAGAWFAPLLLVMHVRHYLDDILRLIGLDGIEGLRPLLEVPIVAVPAVGAALLIALSMQGWAGLVPSDVRESTSE
jgi:MFS transporter, PAT family, beta-lactamase induction signal transducer AmpG